MSHWCPYRGLFGFFGRVTSFHSLFTLSFHSSVHLLHLWTLPKRDIFVAPLGPCFFFFFLFYVCSSDHPEIKLGWRRYKAESRWELWKGKVGKRRSRRREGEKEKKENGVFFFWQRGRGATRAGREFGAAFLDFGSINRWDFFFFCHARYRVFRDYSMLYFVCCCLLLFRDYEMHSLLLLLVVVWNRFAAFPPPCFHHLPRTWSSMHAWEPCKVGHYRLILHPQHPLIVSSHLSISSFTTFSISLSSLSPLPPLTQPLSRPKTLIPTQLWSAAAER